MADLQDVLPQIDTLTFDCYGTLISWAEGLEKSLIEVFGDVLKPHLPELFVEYVRVEAEVEAEPYRSYREILGEVVRRLGRLYDVKLSSDKADRLAADLPYWPPFSDTVDALRRLKDRFRLGILSNIDRDLFEGTAHRLVVPFDFVITAEDVQSYKPRQAHFERLLGEFSARDGVLHVAQSLFHDGVPANRLGIAFVWINRYNEANEARVVPQAEFSTLASFADAVCG